MPATGKSGELPVMSEWVQQDVPAFAVVGRVNMGKSAVLATLLEIDDNELIRVSPTPGETTACQIHRLNFGGRECVRFLDTPGFSQPVEAMRAIQALHGPGTPDRESLRRFVEQAADEFGDETRLLEPLLQGAGVLYVVDPAKPLRDDFLAEMEILRWTGRPRLALLNRHDGATDADEERWREKLGGAFNLTRTFDAHRARYDERLRLLGALLDIEERHRPRLEETIRLVEKEWERRREESAEVILGFLEEALALRAAATLEERDLTLPSRRKRKEELLRGQYFERLSGLSAECVGKLLKIHRHTLLRADQAADWLPELDLKTEETWSKWGLGRGQLVAAAAVAGGAAGLAVDAATGGITHGAGTVGGALLGGATAWFKGGSFPDLRIDLRGGIKLGAGEGRVLSLGPPGNPNFPWILLDVMLAHYSRILERAHGRRDEQTLSDVPAGDGRVKHFPSERRAVLAKWFGTCLKAAPDRSLEPGVFEALVAALEESGRGV